MKSRLEKIDNWPELAAAANYRVKNLAVLCQISPSALERFFLRRVQMSVKEWLKRLRLDRAQLLIGSGQSVKNTAKALGIRDASWFSKQFKECLGFLPSKCQTSPIHCENRRCISTDNNSRQGR